MMTSPTPAHLIRLARAGLEANVAPVINEPRALAALAQAGLILQYVEHVVDHEREWLIEEIADIHAMARDVIAMGSDRDGRVADALHDSEHGGLDAQELATIRESYRLASEVLSRCLEITDSEGDSARRIAVDLLKRRIDREHQIKARAGLVFTARVTSQEGSE